MKFSHSREYNKKNDFADDEAGRLVPDLFLSFKNA